MLSVRDNKFLICLGAALTAHVALLFLPIIKVESNKPRTVKRLPIKLQLIAAALPRAQMDSSIKANPKAMQDTTPIDQAPFSSDTEFGIKPTVQPENTPQKNASTVTTRVDSYSLNSRVVIEQLKAQLDKDSEIAANTPRTKTFSKADFIDPAHRNPASTKKQTPLQLLPTLFSKAFTGSSRSAAGQSTDVIRNAQGDAMCWQQRGIPGESQQWYRVPLALCGHLKNP